MSDATIEQLRRLEETLDAVEKVERGARETLLDAIQALLLIDRECWSRAMARVRARDEVLAEALAEDELIGHMLVLHGLHPRMSPDQVLRTNRSR